MYRVLLPIIALAAVLLSQFPQLAQLGLSSLPLAILLGMVIGQFSKGEMFRADQVATAFYQKRCLRAGIILFGLNLSFQQIADVGIEAVFLNLIVICAVLALGLWFGLKLLRLPLDTVILISAGSAICGAAAVLATDSAIKARQQQVTIAVATVVLFGTLAMFVYPLLFPYTQMTDQAFGIYIGSTVHEVAQAVAAGESISAQALDYALVTKLIRVMWLAPFVLLIGVVIARYSPNTEKVNPIQVMPWFVLGFIATAGLNSLFAIPVLVLDMAAYLSQFLLALAMASLGIQTRLCLIKQAGLKPIILAFALFILLMAGGFFLNLLLI